jgi:GH24 family phage-related lysozyme (muramidase)
LANPHIVKGNIISTSVSLTTTQANALTNAAESAIYNQLSQAYTTAAVNNGFGGWDSLNANQQTAIYDYTYNYGIHRFDGLGILDSGKQSTTIWNYLVHDKWSDAAQSIGAIGARSNNGAHVRRVAEAKLLDPSYVAAIDQSGTLVAANDTSYALSASDGTTQYALDPSGPYLTLIEGSGSPAISSILLPFSEASSYLVSYEIGSTWSAPQIAQPDETITLPAGGVNGLRVVMLDGSGNPVQGTPDFTFFLTFASAGCKRRSNNPSLKRPGVPVAPE